MPPGSKTGEPAPGQSQRFKYRTGNSGGSKAVKIFVPGIPVTECLRTPGDKYADRKEPPVRDKPRGVEYPENLDAQESGQKTTDRCNQTHNK